MTLRIDFNADLGEGAGHDAGLLALVTSANLACGFHAGDPATILATLGAAREAGVAVGAHPSLADRAGFGRRELPITPDDAFSLVTFQVGAFAALATAAGLRPQHVKPHGALYNMAARDPELADAVARAVASFDRSLLLFAPPASALARAGAARGLRVVSEFFADRNYLPDGSLVPRSHADALLHDPAEAAARLLRVLREGVVRAVDDSGVAMRAETICVHGDTPDAVAFARALRRHLEAAGIAIRPAGVR
ncbi:MAG: 5-oxoprolinase (ATP-hydrolyzing) subunit [Chthoniobacter sp.]|jgi:UPF0271 protein|nr:5-oxoprolinase (ATP-hydrolyzing) subunit [Chthoniobacter sp.]